jgi:hypothetical protein
MLSLLTSTLVIYVFSGLLTDFFSLCLAAGVVALIYRLVCVRGVGYD